MLILVLGAIVKYNERYYKLIERVRWSIISSISITITRHQFDSAFSSPRRCLLQMVMAVRVRVLQQIFAGKNGVTPYPANHRRGITTLNQPRGNLLRGYLLFLVLVRRYCNSYAPPHLLNLPPLLDFLTSNLGNRVGIPTSPRWRMK